MIFAEGIPSDLHVVATKFFNVSASKSPAMRITKAAIRLGIVTYGKYIIDFKKDPKLPSRPETVYKDFPGYLSFFGKDRYKTWQEASKACKILGINSITGYQKFYKKDLKLVYDPRRIYKNFPGWTKFLGK